MGRCVGWRRCLKPLHAIAVSIRRGASGIGGICRSSNNARLALFGLSLALLHFTFGLGKLGAVDGAGASSANPGHDAASSSARSVGTKFGLSSSPMLPLVGLADSDSEVDRIGRLSFDRTQSSRMLSRDLRATVERELEALKHEGWVVVEKIDKGRFRRSHGLRAAWERTPWAKERENLQQHGGSTVRTAEEIEQLEESDRRDCLEKAARSMGRWPVNDSTNDPAEEAERIGGAAAIVNLARRAIMPVTMTDAETKAYAGSVLPSERFKYFKLADVKSNLAPLSAEAPWYELASVELPNAEPPTYPHGDRVQVVKRARLTRQKAGSPLGSEQLAVRFELMKLIDRGVMIDGETVPYSPNSTGKNNQRAILDAAMAAVERATPDRPIAHGSGGG